MWSSKNHPCGYFASATRVSAACMWARSAALGARRCSPNTAIGTSHESQSSTTKRNGSSYSAYHVVVRASAQSSQSRTDGRLPLTGDECCAQGAAPAAASHLSDVGGLRPLLAFGHLELDPLPFLEAAESLAGDGAVVHEHVLTVVPADEPVSLLRVEPLH